MDVARLFYELSALVIVLIITGVVLVVIRLKRGTGWTLTKEESEKLRVYSILAAALIIPVVIFLVFLWSTTNYFHESDQLQGYKND